MTASGPSVLVTGIGLMGGSLAAALAGLGWRVLLHHRRPEVARQAQALGYGTAIERIDEAADVGIAVVCTPVGAIVDAVRTVAASTAAIITDVGSTKNRIVSELSALGDRFVGSHPMAGSHRQGLEHADPGLFRGCVTVVTPVAATPAPALAAVEALWRAIGSRVVRL
ncbi:MAG: prephenate dehydrogenase/arogenate dehydrogenase family protein, partial [Planctomycetes bacterium]|nr:prephenate dehydrogenase/arogenate dehydrogenase family protein [Planctomycetota bacterium]